MAIAEMDAKIISRSTGRSAVAAAAYRSGTRLPDERYGRVQDYSQRHGVLHSEIMAPADTPKWMLDRAELWNGVEAAEKRKDSQLARDVLLILPHELTDEGRLSAVRAFVQEQFVDEGMIADIAMHAPHPGGDDRNYHCHVMLTMRELTGEGFGPKNRAWNDDALVPLWRQQFERHVNAELEREGIEERVDLRSLEARGIDREPEPKQGPIATQMEREGRESHAGNDRRATKELNAERDALHEIEAQASAEIFDLEAERRSRQGEGAPSNLDVLRQMQAYELKAQEADQSRRREAFIAEWKRSQAEETAKLEARQQQRAEREENLARVRAAQAPDPEAGLFDRLSWRFNQAWSRVLDTLDPSRAEERERKERAEAEARARARAVREQKEREKLAEKQKAAEREKRRELRQREGGERRALLQEQDRQYVAAERREREDLGQTRDFGPELDRGLGRDDDDDIGF